MLLKAKMEFISAGSCSGMTAKHQGGYSSAYSLCISFKIIKLVTFEEACVVKVLRVAIQQCMVHLHTTT